MGLVQKERTLDRWRSQYAILTIRRLSITYTVSFLLLKNFLLCYNGSMDFTRIYKKYKGLWVALADDEQTVMGKGKTVKDAVKEAKEQGENDPILFKVPTKIIPYIGSVA